jgi:hypothetical protein
VSNPEKKEDAMNIWSTLGIGPVTGVGALLTGLVCAGAFALLRLRRKARAKTFDLGLQSIR